MPKPDSNQPSATPPSERYFEDYQQGSKHILGPIDVKRDEVISFAERYDPQPFHTDPELAKSSVFGGLIASGWHTGAMLMRVLVNDFVSQIASLGSPGMDEIRWLAPVRPGDELWVHVEVIETRRSRSKPDRGIVRTFIKVINQHDQVVMSVYGSNFFLCAPQSNV